MISRRDPARAGLQVVVAALLVVVGVLDAFSGLLPGGWVLLGWLGVVLAVVAAVWGAIAVRRCRSERTRSD